MILALQMLANSCRLPWRKQMKDGIQKQIDRYDHHQDPHVKPGRQDTSLRICSEQSALQCNKPAEYIGGCDHQCIQKHMQPVQSGLIIFYHIVHLYL